MDGDQGFDLNDEELASVLIRWYWEEAPEDNLYGTKESAIVDIKALLAALRRGGFAIVRQPHIGSPADQPDDAHNRQT